MRSKTPIRKLIGRKSGRLTIIKEADPYIYPNGKIARKMLCQCECGNKINVRLNHFSSGLSQSCGCLRKEIITKHGLSKYPLYAVWANMKRRCYDKKNDKYKDYGGRGIIVCAEWKNDPEIFIEWALSNGWEKSLLIDRRDNDDDYEPLNIRFVDKELSSRNQRLLRSTNKSGYRGVCWNKNAKKWAVAITTNNRRKHLGYFTDKIKAALKYDKVAIKLNSGHPLNYNNIIINL